MWQFISSESRVRLVRQNTNNDCGYCCFAMVANFYRCFTSVAELRELFGSGQAGVSLATIKKASEHWNLAFRAIKADSTSDFLAVKMPCILHWKGNHFVVLSSYRNDKFELFDPGKGKRLVPLEEFEKNFSGIYAEIRPTQKTIKVKENYKSRLRLLDLMSFSKEVQKGLILSLLTSLIFQILIMSAPLYGQMVIDKAILGGQLDIIPIMAVGFSFVILFQLIVRSAREWCVLNLLRIFGKSMSSNIFDNLLALPLKFYNERDAGLIISKINSIASLRKILSHRFIATTVDGVFSVMSLALIFYYSTKLALVTLCFSLLYIAVRLLFQERFKSSIAEKLASEADAQSYLVDYVESVKSIKLFGGEDRIRAKLMELTNQQIDAEVRHTKVFTHLGAVQQLIFAFENITSIIIAAYIVVAGELSIGMLFAFIAYKAFFINSLDNLAVGLLEFKEVEVHLERLSDFVHTKKENPAEDIAFRLRSDKKAPSIEIKGLSFKYSEDADDIFTSFNATIPSGKTTAIIGKSGVGKTTLLNCLLGILDSSSGTIYVDDIKISSLQKVASIVGTVTQNDCLLTGTIADNISFFSEEPDVDWLLQCAQIACIDSDIVNLPMGFNTIVNRSGSMLSGGQIQRILLARAIYRRPKILLMDEATNQLDLETEFRVLSNLKDLGTTNLLVAHRDETIKFSDNVFEIRPTNE